MEDDLVVSVPRDRLLSNQENKSKMIMLISQHLRATGLEVLQARADADTLIVRSALSSAREGHNSIVIGEDTDLPVLLTALTCPESENTFMLMLGRAGAPPRVFDVSSLGQKMQGKANVILVFYAFSGCDTTVQLTSLRSGS